LPKIIKFCKLHKATNEKVFLAPYYILWCLLHNFMLTLVRQGALQSWLGLLSLHYSGSLAYFYYLKTTNNVQCTVLLLINKIL